MDENLFKKRPGTTDRGKDYENLMVAGLVLKLLRMDTVKDFSLTSNDEKFGTFDDVVLQIQTHEIQHIYAMQLKHANREKALTKSALLERRGNFSLRKYFEEFQKIQISHFPNKFILFTNLKFSVQDGEKIQEKNGCLELEVVEASKEFLLNTSIEGCCYKFKTNQEDYRKFFDNFYLYTNQASVDKVKEDVAKHFEATISYSDNLALKEYIDFISEWSLKEGKKTKLTKKMMGHVISLCLLSPFIVPLSFENVVNCRSKIMQEAISKFSVTNFKIEYKNKVQNIYSDSKTKLGNIIEINKFGLRYQIIANYVEDINTLSDLDKSKLLWLMDSCPLIVKYNDIVRCAINLCEDKSFIILGNGASSRGFQNLFNLYQKSSDLVIKILQNFYCSLHGKKAVTLETLIGHDEKLFPFITTNELILMLDNSLLIGGPREILPVPYIKRFFTSNLIDIKFLYELNDDVLIVINYEDNYHQIKEYLKDFCVVKVEEYLTKNAENRNDENEIDDAVVEDNIGLNKSNVKKIYVREENSMWKFEEICRRIPHMKTCHHFRFNSEQTLEWIQGIGDLINLEQYKLEEKFDVEESLHGTTDKINIICGDPGMGKSIFVKNIKNCLPPEIWTFIIYPKDYSNFSGTTSDEFFAQIITKKHLCPLELKLIHHLKEKKEIAIIWDGLDETPQGNLKTVISLFKIVYEDKFTQFITTRNNLKKVLEKEFLVFARNIKPFNSEDQDAYIKERLRLESDDDIVEKLIKHVELFRYNDILGIPLQIYMLTELFLQNREKYSIFFQNDIFSITDLYHHFVDEKFNVYYKEKAKLEISSDAMQQVILNDKKIQLENYEKASLKLFFRDLNIDCYYFLDQIQRIGDSFGIITEVTSEKIPTFIHNSYGEYFAAMYFSKKYKKIPTFKTFIFEERFKNIRFLFDLLLAKNCPAHMAILYRNFDVLMDYKEFLKCRDSAGRNVLHLACLWTQKYRPLNVSRFGFLMRNFIITEDNINIVKRENADYEKILDFLARNCDPYEIDEFFAWDCFSYAKNFHCLLPMIILSKIHNKNLCTLDIANVLYYSIRFDYAEVFDVIEEVPLIQTEKSQENLLHLAVKYNAIHCLQKILAIPEYSSRINEGDKYCQKPLNLACIKGQIEIVRLLIKANADVNNTSNLGTSALMLASFKGHLDLIQMLISAKANISAKNIHGFNALHIAATVGRVEVVKLLLNLNVDRNILLTTTKSGLTALSLAILKGHKDVVLCFINHNINIVNAPYFKNMTPLHYACLKGYSEIVRYLIKSQAKVNILDDNGYTPLHLACKKGVTEIVQMLIDCEGINVDTIGKNGMTPFLVACLYGHTKIVRLLINAGANINAENSCHQTGLDLARRTKDIEIEKLLNEVNVDFNYVFCYSESHSLSKWMLKPKKK